MAIAVIATASIVTTTATGTDRRGRGTVRDMRTGAPTASAPDARFGPAACRAVIAGLTGVPLPVSSAAAMRPIDGPAIHLPRVSPLLDDLTCRA
ncbi:MULTISPECIES: hypothetical protein [Burkholderia]|uniref:hypothetical protein n=1 Tax=Burkholderia TaxID=32008 RepID=UPI000F5B4BDA|nr:MULTISPECIES: hypothetical protein [Burkholderia]MBN3742728.1 hypothetical protein [Burkholderia sp. Tr-20355]